MGREKVIPATKIKQKGSKSSPSPPASGQTTLWASSLHGASCFLVTICLLTRAAAILCICAVTQIVYVHYPHMHKKTISAEGKGDR